MQENIVINFESNTQGITSTITALQQAEQISKKNADAFTQAGNAAKDFGDKAQQGATKAGTAAKETEKELGGLGKSIEKIGELIIAAFAIEKIISFGKETVKAFAAAELAATKLNFAITKVVGGTTEQVKQLQIQSEKLSKTSYFSPRQIQESQAMLAQFGLTAKEIEELTPKIIGLAVAQGGDLAEATNTATRAITGQTRGLKTVGAAFKDTGDQVQNLGLLNEKLSKFSGLATEALNTTSGALQNQEKEIELLKEKIGSDLAGAWVGTEKAALSYFSNVVVGVRTILEPSKVQKEFLDQQKQAAVEAVENSTKQEFAAKTLGQINAAIREAEKEDIVIHKKLQETYTGEFNAENLRYHQQDVLNQARIATLKELAAQQEHDYNLEKFRKEDLSKLTKAQLEDEKKQLESGKFGASSSKDIESLILKREEALAKLVKFEEEAAKKAEAKREEAARKYNELLKKIGEESAIVVEDDEAKKLSIKEQYALADLEQTAKDNGVNIKSDEKYLKAKKELQDKYFQLIFDAELTQAEKEIKLNEEKQKKLKGKEYEIHPNRDDFKEQEKDEKEWAKRSEEINKELAKKKKEIAAQTVETIINGLFDIATAQSQIDIQTIEEQKNRQNTSVDNEIKALEDKHNKKHISDKKYQQELEKLQKKKEENDKIALKKENEIKHQQDIANRERQLFNIAIATAKNIVETPLLLPYYLALGAAEAAIVLATPLPKYHTGRLAKHDQSEEHAIIRKDETIFDPQKSKEYAPTFRAIYDGKIKSNLLNDFVGFQLRAGNTTYSNNMTIDYDLLAKKVGSEISWSLRGDRKTSLSNETILKLAEVINDDYNPRR